jgi:Domain of Unknown Function (DUF1080)
MQKILTLALAFVFVPTLPIVWGQDAKTPKTEDKSKDKSKEKDGWKQLLGENSLGDWSSTEFGGEAMVSVEDFVLTIEAGEPLTGITYKKEFPKNNFEIELEAQRVEGSDFLCGLTFPVGDEHLSFIAGGWGGGVVGLSSIDGFDAAENATTQFQQFKNKQWYRFRVRVDDKKIQAWIDDKQVVDQEREGHKFSLRGEVLANRPLGYCTFQTKALVRNFRWRTIENK